MVAVVYLGLVVEEGENTKAVRVMEGQVSLPRVDKVHKLPPSSLLGRVTVGIAFAADPRGW